MQNNFYELAKQCHENRIEQAYQNKLDNPKHLAKIKTDFIFYYRMNKKPFSIETFKQFLVDEKVKVNSIEEIWLVNRIFG